MKNQETTNIADPVKVVVFGFACFGLYKATTIVGTKIVDFRMARKEAKITNVEN